jgi:hypothetical protein
MWIGGPMARPPRSDPPTSTMLKPVGQILRPIHYLAWFGDIITLATVLNENPKLALTAIYIPNS